MKLPKKKEKEFTDKIRKIKALEQEKKQTEETISALKDDIRDYMEKTGISELTADIFTIHYTETEAERFDGKAFRNADEALYNQFVKKIITKRFSIT